MRAQGYSEQIVPKTNQLCSFQHTRHPSFLCIRENGINSNLSCLYTVSNMCQTCVFSTFEGRLIQWPFNYALWPVSPPPLNFFQTKLHDCIPYPSHSKYTKWFDCGCYLVGAVLFLVNLLTWALRPLIWASFSWGVWCFNFLKTHLQCTEQLETWHIHSSAFQKHAARLFPPVSCMGHLVGVFYEPTPENFHIFLHFTI